jgi:hypothetical protein
MGNRTMLPPTQFKFFSGDGWSLAAGGIAVVATTMIYLHVMQKPGLGVKSPLDRI